MFRIFFLERPRHVIKPREKEKDPFPSLSRLVLHGLTTLGDTLENLLTVLIELELGDDNVGGGNGDGDALAIGLLADNTLDVDHPLKTVDAGDTTFPTFLSSSDHCDLVSIADRN